MVRNTQAPESLRTASQLIAGFFRGGPVKEEHVTLTRLNAPGVDTSEAHRPSSDAARSAWHGDDDTIAIAELALQDLLNAHEVERRDGLAVFGEFLTTIEDAAHDDRIASSDQIL